MLWISIICSNINKTLFKAHSFICYSLWSVSSFFLIAEQSDPNKVFWHYVPGSETFEQPLEVQEFWRRVHAAVCVGERYEGTCMCCWWGATELKVSWGVLKSLWPSQEWPYLWWISALHVLSTGSCHSDKWASFCCGRGTTSRARNWALV